MKHNGEFFSAQASNQLGAFSSLARYLADDRVVDVMAVCIVNTLEMIDIEQDGGKRCRFRPGLQCGVQAIEKRAAIEQARQRVGLGKMHQVLLRRGQAPRQAKPGMQLQATYRLGDKIVRAAI